MPTVPSYLALNMPGTIISQTYQDCQNTKNYGITRIRVAIPDYQNAAYITASRTAALIAKTYGFYVIYGISSNTLNNGDYAITVHNWADYIAAATTEATWAQANGIDEFYIGNEEEIHNYKEIATGKLTRAGAVATCDCVTNHNMVNGDTITVLYANQAEYNGAYVITRIDDHIFTYAITGTPASPATGPILAYGMTNAALQTNLRALAVTVDGVFSGVISYSTHPYRIYDWIGNLGTLDKIGFNVYGCPLDPDYSYDYFKYAITKCMRNFGNKFELTEFNISPFPAYFGTEEQYADYLANQIAFIMKIGLPVAYFFTYTRGNYAVIDNANNIRPAYWSLFGVRKGTA